MPAPLERSIRLPAPLAARGTICSTTRARASRPHGLEPHRHARMFRPLDTTPMRIQTRPAPPAAMRLRPRSARLPAHRGSAAYCRTPLRRLRRFLRARRARQSVPTACAAFVASSRAMCVSSKYHSARQWARRAHPLHSTHDPSRAQHLLQPLPIAHAAVITSPPAATVSPPHYPPLEASSCPARGVRYAAPPKYAPRRRRRPPETSACSLLRGASPDPPCAAHAAVVPPSPIPSPLPTSILSAIPPLSTPPLTSHRQRRLRLLR
ncbi:hypothetical protein B0H14DRAFT_50637 [Mycena olivaceomarginata]|nr:hypothetical protein B0H14DRAFT_50637 [Mycena olivaceomarginata]